MSFAFWKKSKPVETDAAKAKDAAPVEENIQAQPAAQPAKLDLNLKSMDSGAFTFEDMERLAQCSPTTPFQKLMERVKPSAASSSIGQVDDDAAELDDEHIQSRCGTPEASADDSSKDLGKMSPPAKEVPSAEKTSTIAPPTRPAPVPKKDELRGNASVSPPSRAAPMPPTTDKLRVSSPILAPSRAAPLPPTTEEPRASSSVSPPSRPAPTPPTIGTSPVPSRSFTPPSRSAPLPPARDISQSRPTSFSSRPISTVSTASTSQQADSPARRLHRPTELNLGSVAPNGSKPQSELEKQSSLMRNSMARSKAALRSPTELLNMRLSMTSKKSKPEEKVRVFTPPQPSNNGCLLPGPAGQIVAFASTSVRARTALGRPAWWCKYDKLVVFDGMGVQENGEQKFHTRTSKGLIIARRRGETETVVIPMDCAHCQEMLNRHEWTYDIQVCKRSVCWDCKERCKWERDQEVKEQAENVVGKDDNRERADSVLQDDEAGTEDLMRKMGIEQGRPRSPIEVVGGIEERLVGIAL